jgi:hypothetical protein
MDRTHSARYKLISFSHNLIKDFTKHTFDLAIEKAERDVADDEELCREYEAMLTGDRGTFLIAAEMFSKVVLGAYLQISTIVAPPKKRLKFGKKNG